MREKAGSTRARRRRCTSAAASSSGWTTGDNVNLAVGQGDLQATPLQVAVAYSAIANSGTIVHAAPRQGDRGRQRRRRCRSSAPSRAARSRSTRRDRQVVLDGLRRAANEDEGTSADVFKDWPKQYTVYGKTGTAERQPNPDQSWYACFVKDKGQADRRRRHGRARRLRRGNCGTRGAPDPLQWFDVTTTASSTRGPTRRN